MNKIEVVSLRLVDPKESGLRGFADISVEGIILRDFRIVHRNGRPFIEPPHITVRKNGQQFYNQLVTFPEEMKVQVETAILAAYFQKEQTYEHQPE